jgi:hypothetical protein
MCFRLAQSVLPCLRIALVAFGIVGTIGGDAEFVQKYRKVPLEIFAVTEYTMYEVDR